MARKLQGSCMNKWGFIQPRLILVRAVVGSSRLNSLTETRLAENDFFASKHDPLLFGPGKHNPSEFPAPAELERKLAHGMRRSYISYRAGGVLMQVLPGGVMVRSVASKVACAYCINHNSHSKEYETKMELESRDARASPC